MWPSVGLQETAKISLERKFVRMTSTATDGSLEEDMREDIWVRCGVYYGGGYYSTCEYLARGTLVCCVSAMMLRPFQGSVPI